VPLQVAVFPLQFPELAAATAVMLLYVPAKGLLQFGAPVQVIRSALTTDDEPLLPLQVTVGLEVIAIPAVPSV